MRNKQATGWPVCSVNHDDDDDDDNEAFIIVNTALLNEALHDQRY